MTKKVLLNAHLDPLVVLVQRVNQVQMVCLEKMVFLEKMQQVQVLHHQQQDA